MKKGENALFTIFPELACDASVNYEVKLEDGTVIAKCDTLEIVIGHLSPVLAKAVKNYEDGFSVLMSHDEATIWIRGERSTGFYCCCCSSTQRITADPSRAQYLGEGYEKPSKGAVVKVKLIGKLQDNMFIR
ncbi:hypothetical protein POM88_014533 [Heracleum sosnowskyi]|uniref:Uncharacterized protein n=1 Tax=Heracleum sosnowskyi TaxID=360622 RepID=A0AAD8N493_9APIA|nr:hypothetical protein POM88_014533 [Heracleum sosnowskyi]